MKLPNGYGTIYKEKGGNRRRRWQVKLPAKYELVDGKAVCIRPTLGWYVTRAEALRALAEWHKDPALYNARTVTLAELYRDWIAGKHLSVTSVRNYTSAWNNMAPLHELALSEIDVGAIERLLASVPEGAQHTIYTVLRQLFDYAVARDALPRSPMNAVRRPATEPKIKRTLYSPEEIARLWESQSDPHAAYLLILLYSGMRAKEPFTVTEDHGDFIIAGSKTKAGRGRIIPIHSKVRPLWAVFLEDSKGVSAETYYARILRNKPVVGDHTLHDTRYTFISRMAALDVPELALQKIVGHAHNSITSDLYTIKQAPELCAYVERLSYLADNVRTTGESI